jgi:hypothetical protein
MQGYPFTVGLPAKDAEYSLLTGPPIMELETAMITPFPSVLPAVWPLPVKLTHEMVGTLVAAAGRSKVGDA